MMARAQDRVAAYIAAKPTAAQPVLREVRRLIRAALPGAEETMGYQMPAYRLDGRIVVYFAGWTQHWSLYPVTPTVRDALGADLARYDVSKGTVRFPLDAPVPARVVTRLVKTLAKARTR